MQIKIGDNGNQTINTNLQAQEKAGADGRQKAARQQRKTVIFAGELPFHKDSITLRRQQAQKQAMKFVQDAWDSDRKTDQGMDEIRARQEVQRREAQRNWDQAQELNDKREGLRGEYDVDPESQEQKDLELLMRAASPYDDHVFTEEEEARLADLKEQPLTEYQERSLSLYKDQVIFENRAKQAEDYAGYLQSSLTDMKIERLKHHEMADAQNKAEKVMEQASKDIQGMMIDEAKDHVDETYEEKREEAEAKAEEKEAQEKKIELRREQKELMEARIDEIREDGSGAEEAQKDQERDAREEASFLKDMADAGMDVAGSGAAVKAEIKDMLNKMNLIEADIKGIEVDEEV